MAKFQRAVRVNAFDTADWKKNISVEQVEVPEPSSTQALVKMILRPVNPSDLLAVQGIYAGFQPDKLPATPGMDGLGIVEKSAGKFKEGQRVVGVPWPASKGYGTYQEYYVAEEDQLEAVPDGVSDEAAASFWINPVAAVGLIRSLNAPKGSWLIQGAAGSHLGRQVIEIAKDYGLKTINLVRRSQQKQELLDIGADVVIGTDEMPDYVEEVKKITGGEGPWGAFDPIAGENTGKLLSAIRPKGTVFVYGVLSGLTLEANVPDLLFLGKSIQGFWLMPWFEELEKPVQQEVIKEIFRLLENVIGAFKGKTFPLEEAVAALEETTKTGNTGKSYLTS